MEGSNRENMQADEHQDSFTSQDHQEESGWTFYLDDDEFFPRNDNNSRENGVQLSSSSCYDETPSMISDADSLAPWNINKFMDSNTSKKLGLLNKKKKKINSGTDDPDMEDTASSPVNSPKVSSMKQYHRHMNSPRQNHEDDDIDIEYSTSQQRRKGSMSGDHPHFSELQLQEERNNPMDFVQSNTSNPRRFTDLKEKGLCVVPLSMFVNYLK